MPTTFPRPAYFVTTLRTAHVASDGQLALQTGDGARLGALGANQVYAITAVRTPGPAETILANFTATGLSTDTLTGVAADADSTDVNVPSGTPLQVRVTAAWQRTVQSAINNLEAITEVSVTGATALTSAAYGKYHVCSGTAADYTVTLPDASGHAGQTIGFRMSSSLTRFVTIAASSGQAIDGAASRLMWASETAVLESDGTNWFKLNGRSVPMMARMRLSANQTVFSTLGALTTVTLDSSVLDNTARMVDTVNHRIVVRRAGVYHAVGYITWNNLTASGVRMITDILQNGAIVANGEAYGQAGGYPVVIAVGAVVGAAGDLITMGCAHNTGGVEQIFGSSQASCYLLFLETPQW